MKTSIVLLAEGFETIEALSPVDILRRAGVDVVVAGVGSYDIKSCQGVTVHCDALASEVAGRHFDAVVLPGGMPGASNLLASPDVMTILSRANADKCLVCAICASPAVVLGSLGLLNGRKATCYPGLEGTCPLVDFTGDRVVRDANYITSRGPGCSTDFGLAIAAALVSPEAAARISDDMVWGDR